MIKYDYLNTEVLLVTGIIYVFLALSIAKLGTYKTCGGWRAFVVSFILTPIVGIIYVSLCPVKSILKIIHYRCNHCGLEYTTEHKYCPSCLKEGNKYKLQRISMKTY
ncbi:MAG: hypothetical protein KDC05_10295 [Bacteroidales bacterium]|nr:hypothetical protein [Bacteroidales bacterium]